MKNKIKNDNVKEEKSEKRRKIKIKILRFNGKERFYVEYNVPNLNTVLEALLYIRENIDSTLAFNHACRSGICGACAVKIDGIPKLACKTPLKNDITIEPLDGFKVVRDLIVDEGEFFEVYRKVGLCADILDGKEVDEEIRRKIYVYDRCILCLICVSVCPVCRSYCYSRFLSPAILAKAYRLFLDERNTERKKILKNIKKGVNACEFYYKCVKNCPRGVPPALAIKEFKKLL